MRRLRHLGVCRVAVRVRLVSVCMSGPLEFCVSVSSWFCVLHGGNEKVPEDSGSSVRKGMLGAFWVPRFLALVLLGNEHDVNRCCKVLNPKLKMPVSPCPDLDCEH